MYAYNSAKNFPGVLLYAYASTKNSPGVLLYAYDSTKNLPEVLSEPPPALKILWKCCRSLRQC